MFLVTIALSIVTPLLVWIDKTITLRRERSDVAVEA